MKGTLLGSFSLFFSLCCLQLLAFSYQLASRHHEMEYCSMLAVPNFLILKWPPLHRPFSLSAFDSIVVDHERENTC
jgi:hypothetical protein